MMSKRSRKRIKNWFIYIFVLFIVKLLRNLSRIGAIKLMRLMGSIVFRLAKREREKTIRHLTWAFGDKKTEQQIERLAKQVFLHFSTVAVDAIRMPLVLKEGIDKYVRTDNLPKLDKLLAVGKGAIIITGHFGNWELLGAYLAQCGYPLKVVGTSAYDNRLDKMIVETRNLAGYENIARGKGTREIVRHLRSKGFLGILIDQDTKVDGVFVNFFKRPAHTAVGPVVLAEKFNVPIIPVFIRLNRNLLYEIEAFDPIVCDNTGDPEKDLISNTQKCSDAYEQIISRYPSQWVWMHERWKKQPQEAEL
ncbi:lysophospholipid acyltransferase family protein [candidate division KSB1 bacterium]|nr:lysophospholipid acyltransferase family protein [candidate division KSB1 bacterium]